MSAFRNFFSGFVRGFREFGTSVSGAVNFILLLIVYFIGIGITSLAGKAFGKRFLEMKPDRESYWFDLEKTKKRKEEYRRMF